MSLAFGNLSHGTTEAKSLKVLKTLIQMDIDYERIQNSKEHLILKWFCNS